MTTHFQIGFHYTAYNKRAITQAPYIRVIYAFKTMSCWTVQFSLYSISHSFRIITETFFLVF